MVAVRSFVDAGTVQLVSVENMAFLIIVLFMSTLRVALPLKVHHRDPPAVLYHGPGPDLHRIQPAAAWKHLDDDWATGLLDSAAGRRASWMRVHQLLRLLHSWHVHRSRSALHPQIRIQVTSTDPDPCHIHRSRSTFIRSPEPMSRWIWVPVNPDPQIRSRSRFQNRGSNVPSTDPDPRSSGHRNQYLHGID